MPDYRLYFMGARDHIRHAVVLTCETDDEAIALVERHRDGRAMELWERARLVMSFPAAAPADADPAPDRLPARVRTALGRMAEMEARFRKNGYAPDRLLQEGLDTAIQLMGADKGTLQLRESVSGALVIAAQRGFADEFLSHFSSVKDRNCACGEALSTGGEVIVEDVVDSPIFTDPKTVRVLRRANVRAVCSMPWISSGRVSGMISTHYSRPTSLKQNQVAGLSLLARKAGRALEDAFAAEARRR